MEKKSKEKPKLLTISEKVIRLKNSKSRFIKIPNDEFKEISHGDEAFKILRDENDKEIHVIFVFNKKTLKRLK